MLRKNSSNSGSYFWFLASLCCCYSCYNLGTLTHEGTGGGRLGVDSFAIPAVLPSRYLVLRSPETYRVSTGVNAIENASGSRYLCLLEDYETTKGPYFFALLDQLFEQTGHERKLLAFLTTTKDLESIPGKREEDKDGTQALAEMLTDLESSLELDGPARVFVLDDWNPLKLEEHFSARGGKTDGDKRREEDPTMVWLYGTHNAFVTRHLLRTSGFDRWIHERCGSALVSGEGSDRNGVFVGEGTGAACSGTTMDAARARGDDPKASPELQAFGLGLLGGGSGNGRTEGVVFANNSEERESLRKTHPTLEVCKNDEVFVWAQPPPDAAVSKDPTQQVATKIIMAPNRRGTIEACATVDPLPPLVIRSRDTTTEGVACYGEPSVDPSRSAQAGTIGDSEWWE